MRVMDAAFRRASVGMAITDHLGRYLEVNASLCEFLGFTAEQLLQRSFRDVSTAEDAQMGSEAMQDLASGALSEFQLEKQYVAADGTLLWARTTGFPVHDEHGRLSRVIVQVEDLTSRLAVQAALHWTHHHDDLTDLSTRRRFYDLLDAALEMPARSVRGLALLVVDLDRFHQVNAGLGRDVGDAILREVAQRLAAVVRGGDAIARLGGDEFAVLARNLRTSLDAITLAIDIRTALGKPYWSSGNAVYVSARVGIVTGIEDESSDTLVQMGVAAVEAAKSLAVGWSMHTTGDETSSREEIGLVNDLRAAIASGEITVVYQPVVDRSGNLHHMEALARWQHSERGAVGPDQFIVLAEHNNLIAPLTAWVIESALAQTAAWHAGGFSMSVAVNLSGKLLDDDDLVERIETALQRAGLSPSSLTLEITETALADEKNPVIWAALQRLRGVGVRISIDDFGTGYSSLTYLRQLPVDELKIDRSFILDLDTDVRSDRIVRSIIDLAHSLGLEVVAEGVENAMITERLRSMQVDFVQGYVIAKPATGAAMTAWMQDRAVTATPVRTAPTRAGRRTLDILVIGADMADSGRLTDRLRADAHHVRSATNGASAAESLQSALPDVIILDHALPATSVVDTTPLLREAGYNGPILLFGGCAPDDLAAARYPMDVWPIPMADEALLLGLIEGYATSTS